jgi:predicted TIM-barrel fold metal-dependent hydrolase
VSERYRIISADSHVSIPKELVQSYLPASIKEKVAAIEAAYAAQMLAAKPQKNKQKELVEERASNPLTTLPNMGKGAPWPAAGRPGGSDAIERLKDMDTDGVEAEILYVGAGGAEFAALEPQDRIEASRAANSAAIEWASVDPKRLMPVYSLPIDDPKLAVKELDRIVAEHAKAVQLPLLPREQGLPPYWDTSYDPLWEAMSHHGVPISMHVGGNSYLFNQVLPEDPTPFKGIFQCLPPISMSELMADWILSGILERFPDLRIVFVEAGIGWIPYFLERLDNMAEMHGWDTFPTKAIKEKPSHYWYRNMAATFETDHAGMRLIDLIGYENLMFATDYPHPDSTWPNTQQVFQDHFANIDRDKAEMVASGNVTRIYKL